MKNDGDSGSNAFVKPSISLVMPNYNHSAYLHQSVHGMLSQQLAADEIIIIDDASTDGSLDLLNELAAQHPSIRIIALEENKGALSALNLGLAEARGDLIAFPGADDFLFPEFIEDTTRLLQEFPEAGFAAGGAYIWDGNDHITGQRPIIYPTYRPAYVSAADYRRKLKDSDNHFLGAATLYRRSVLVKIGGFDPELGSVSDGMSARRIAARHGFCFTPKPIGAWRIHGGNYSLSMITSREQTNVMSLRIKSVLDGEPHGLFPNGYADRLIKRLNFGIGRILANESKGNDLVVRARLSDLAGGTGLDRSAIYLASLLKPFSRTLFVSWLTIRLRPYALWRLAIEPIRRRYRA